LGTALSLCAGEEKSVTLELRNGDRLTGNILSEDDQRIVLATPWNVAIFVPKAVIERRTAEFTTPGTMTPEPGVGTSSNAVCTANASAAPTVPVPAVTDLEPVGLTQSKPSPSASTPAKAPKRWKWNFKLGTDFINGAKDREIYFAETSLVYTRNYEQDPKQFLRNKIEYSVNYGRTDGEESANSMAGANKLDFDVASDFYGYAAAGAGYDKVRKIEAQYELGPGVGYHVLAERLLALDTELGINYQDREGTSGTSNRRALQARIGQELTWEVVPKVTLSQQAAVLPFLDDPGEYQLRVEGTMGFGIVRYLSLNLTVRNLYDTQPEPGVPNNEFQFRSSLGVSF